MQNILPVLCFIAGAALAWLAARYRRAAETAVLGERLAGREQQLRDAEAAGAARETHLAELRDRNLALAAREAELAARLETERTSAAGKLALLEDAQANLADAFRALSGEALRSNNQAFLDLARATLEKSQEAARGELEQRRLSIEATVRPVRESLDRVDSKLRELETVRAGAYAALTEQVAGLLRTQAELRSETGKLVGALRTPAARGNWGEIQLRRVVEMAGMLEYCDFRSQAAAEGDEGRLRPDLLIRLPGGKHVVVDAKTPLEAYLRAVEAEDEETRKARLADHARQVRNHVGALSKKSYWDQFDPAPEFVELFLPGECFFSAALESDPSLIEAGAVQRVILATPTTLIALLRAVAYGWRQEKLARNAAEISQLGRDLYKRLSDMGSHWVKVGKSLDRAVESYNAAVGSLETRVLPSARRFVELETTAFGVDLEVLEPVDKKARELQAPELVEAAPCAP